jgi:hypothetical protein
MFGSNLKRREGIRCLADAFGGCSAGIRRFGKKIEFCISIKLSQIWSDPISLPSLRIPAKQPPNTSARHLITSRLFRLLPNIIGNEKTLGKIFVRFWTIYFLKSPLNNTHPKNLHPNAYDASDDVFDRSCVCSVPLAWQSASPGRQTS